MSVCKHEIIGIRPGEKLHEEMITETDALNSLEFKNHYVILPSMQFWDVNRYVETFEGRRCRPDFRYSSDTNTEWLAVKDLRRLIRSHVDKNFAMPEEDPDEGASGIRDIRLLSEEVTEEGWPRSLGTGRCRSEHQAACETDFA